MVSSPPPPSGLTWALVQHRGPWLWIKNRGVPRVEHVSDGVATGPSDGLAAVSQAGGGEGGVRVRKPTRFGARGRAPKAPCGPRIVLASSYRSRKRPFSESPAVLANVRWKAPHDNTKAIEMVRSLRAAGVAVQVALEPTGSYGDALRHQLAQHDVKVYRVSGKRTHDAREVYDGVPSLHDAKSAAIIAKLHFDGASTLWPTPADAKRRLQASIARMEMFKSHYLRLVNMLEGLIRATGRRSHCLLS